MSELFTKSFSLFSVCHNIYDAKYAADTDIAQLGELCQLALGRVYTLTYCMHLPYTQVFDRNTYQEPSEPLSSIFFDE